MPRDHDAPTLKRFVRWVTPPLRSPVVTGLMLANVALHVGLLLPLTWGRYFAMADADVYAVAAQHALHGGPLYPLTPQGDPRTPTGGYLPFLYPPPFAAALAPLGWLPHLALVRLSYLLAFAFFWVYAALLARLANGRITVRGVLGAGLILMVFPGTYFNLVAGQVEPLLWTMFALAVIGVGRGGMLAASCLVKPFAAWPLALAAWREPRRVLPWAAAVLAAGILAGGLVCGWDSYAQWLSYTPARMYRVAFFHENVSLGLMPLRLLGFTQLPDWGRVFLLGMYVVMPGLVAWVMRKRPVAVQIAWVGAAAILFAPFSRMYYLPVVLVALACEARTAKTEEQKNRKTGDDAAGV